MARLSGKTPPGSFAERVRATIMKYGMLPPGCRVLVGFSGGPDSVALLCALAELRPSWGGEVAAAHLDHGLRGEAAAADADWAADFCRRRQIPFFRGYWAGKEAAKAGLSPEDAARQARRQFLEDALAQWPGDRIALGHHLDDQAETVLIHLIHGGGLRGLSGIWPVRLPYIRPLLEVRRQEILAYCQALAVEPREDATNRQDTYLRNRLRHRVVPLLEGCNPRFSESAGRLAELARQEDAYLDQLAAAALEKVSAPEKAIAPEKTTAPGKTAVATLEAASQTSFRPVADRSEAYISFLPAAAREALTGGGPKCPDAAALAALEPVLARRALRLWLGRETDQAGIQRILDLAAGLKDPAQATIAGGMLVEKRRGLL
ncbi:MAG: tRNA lysidine(34) synthetase TilS, partial [Peptococcaceae bacterium]|nr:tRNA lysidine(34) synthetase TilS [Peptococcaceae bacterium]